ATRTRRPPGRSRALYPITVPLRPAVTRSLLRSCRATGRLFALYPLSYTARSEPWRDSNPRPRAPEAITGTAPARSKKNVAVVSVQPGCRFERLMPRTGPLRPATTGPPGFEPGPARLELAVLPLTPRASVKRPAGVEPASSA